MGNQGGNAGNEGGNAGNVGNARNQGRNFFVYQVDEFSFKEMRTWVSPRFHLLVFVFGVNQEN